MNPSSIGTYGCQLPYEVDCQSCPMSNKTPFTSAKNVDNSYNLQPRLTKTPSWIDTYTLNPTIGIKYDKSFYESQGECRDRPRPYTMPKPASTIANPAYITNMDARILDSRRGIVTQLDRPPLDGSVRLADVYNDDLTAYGQNYGSYLDINTGQYMYYLDKNIADPYSYPTYVVKSGVTSVLFTDPMGSIKPIYYRSPLGQTLKQVSKDSFTRDSISHREDLMAKQSNVRNQQRWDSRYARDF